MVFGKAGGSEGGFEREFFHKARNESQHDGYNHVIGGAYRTASGGEKIIEYHFSASSFDSKQLAPESDAISACRNYMKLLVQIVFECYQTFGSVIDSAQYYTAENLTALGVSAEDVEESLALPRGWTEGIPFEERIRLLSREFPEPEIDWLFIKYLNVNRFGVKPE